MTKPPVQATVTVSPYRLVRILNLASLDKELNRLYLNVKEDRLDMYGFENSLTSYCTFTSPYLDRIELQRDDPVGAIVDVQSWYDTASRLNNSRGKPETIRDHKFHRSITGTEKEQERRKTFYDQYTDDSSLCMIEFRCNQNSNPATHRTIIAQNQYEDPLPTPRTTLVHWEQVHKLMAKYKIDSIIVGNYKIKNEIKRRYNREYKKNGLSFTLTFATGENDYDYSNHDLFYSNKVTPEEITKALWPKIKTEARRRSPQWVYRGISIADSEISFEKSKLNRISNLFDSNNRFRNPSNLDRAPSSFKTNVDILENLVEAYDYHLGPPYPVELRDGEFILDPKYSGYSSSELYSIEASGPAFRKEVASLDSIVDSLSDKVMLESGPDIPHLAVITQSDGMVLRYLMPDLKHFRDSN